MSIFVPRKSAFDVMAILFAMALEAFPLKDGLSGETSGCLKITPCFGGGEPVVMCLKNAVSAPST